MPDLSPASFAASVSQYRRRRSLQAAMAALLLGAVAPGYAQVALGTSFSYQGQLTEAGQPANGLYDLQVCLFDTPSNPIPLACAPDFADVPVERGVFAISLDFGSTPFSGQQRFLELRVRPGASSGGYTILAPRQLVRATPEAQRANTAPWSGLTGVPAGFADGVDNNSGGTVTSVTAGTGLSGGTITGSGTIGIASGGVGSTQIADGGVATVDIAPGAVGSGQLAPGAVGLAQINPAQVQARINGSCAVGEYLRGINADSSLICEPLPVVHRISTVDDPDNDVGSSTSIAIGSDGLPVISYRDNSAGTVSTVDSFGNVGDYTSIAIGSDGLPVISYHGSNAGALKVAKCSNAACVGTATITTVDDPANRVGEFTSIAIGSDGMPVISYHDSTAGALKVAKCGNASCTGQATITTVQDVNNPVGQFTSIAIGSDGLPVISYRATNGQGQPQLGIAKCDNAACSGGVTFSTIFTGGGNPEHSSIAIGSDGLPIISHRNFGLLVTKCANIACTGQVTTTVVDRPGPDIGEYTSIAIGTDGMPVISYYDRSAGALKVAKCNNAACTGVVTITTADDPSNNVGSFTSIAIGSDGLPVISYRDETAGALKVAKCGTRSCQ